MFIVNVQQHVIELIEEDSNTLYYCWSEEKAAQKKINECIKTLIDTIPFEEITTECFGSLESYRARFNLFDLSPYLELIRYSHASSDNKPQLLPILSEKISKTPIAAIDKHIIKAAYLCSYPEITEIFMRTKAIPPLSLFDPNNQPAVLVAHEEERVAAFTQFTEKNGNDCEMEQKVKVLQRHIRRNIRKQSEVVRIAERYFSEKPNKDIEAMCVMFDASQPYRPKKCSSELATRILRMANTVKLFHSVTHLLCTENVSSILDGCLYGRENLDNLFLSYRPAALGDYDIENGDGNVICMGPDMIDPKCLRNRTLGIELDLDILTSQEGCNRNPTIFYKQRDLGYESEPYQIAIGDIRLVLHQRYANSLANTWHDKGSYEDSSFLVIHDDKPYLSPIWKDLLISYNVPKMHQILTMNFFRYLDGLITLDWQPATQEIEKIYAAIECLDDRALHDFLLNLGQIMSCTSEFNFYGGYQIDMHAVRSITIYERSNCASIDSPSSKMHEINLQNLFSELNKGEFCLFDQLRNFAPEILKSKRFMEHLRSHITNPETLERLQYF